jgi:dipeptidyl aminopeptidase/acylaminoacyl peptidase
MFSKSTFLGLLCAAIALFAGCAPGPEWTAESTPLIERSVIFGNPDKAGATISPDGSRIAYLAPVDGVLNVWVGPADDPASAKPVTNDTDRGIRRYFWAWTGNQLLYMQDKGGDENWRVYSVELESGEIKDLTPFEDVQARIDNVSHLHPEEILVGLNNRIPQAHDLYRINIVTGESVLVEQNDEGYAGYVTDDDYQVRFASAYTPTGGSVVFQKDEQGGWNPFMEIQAEDALHTNPIGFDKSGRILYLIDSRGRNTSALVSHDLDSGEEKVIAVNSMADLSDAMVHPIEKTIEAVAFTYERKEWEIMDESVQADLEYLQTVADGDLEVTSRTMDDSKWIVVYIMDSSPVSYYLYDRESKEARFLFTNRSELEDAPLVKMHPTTISSRDGLKLVSYYSLPIWSDEDGDGKPEEPLPLVLLVHGGPWARDTWGPDPIHQWLANRGYVVMSVNFRGSTGFGKEFTNAGDLEWAGKMHDDLLDAVDWAVNEGIADTDRIAIMGGSYGGYATLVGLTFTPDRFACGVDIVGPSNLITLLNSIPPYWAPVLNIFTTKVGDHRTEEGRAFLTERSPLTRVEAISKPLLIGQGANDPRVKQAEADQIVAAMKEKEIPVTYLLYPDEGHGFARPENNLSFWAVTEVFLAEHLGGKVEPIGDDFEGSSVKVLEGGDQIPDLPATQEAEQEPAEEQEG